MGTVRYALRTDQVNTNGQLPIRLIYSVNGQRKYFVPEANVYRENWDEENQQAVYLDKQKAKTLLPNILFNQLPSAKEVEAINDKLGSIRKEIRKIEELFSLNHTAYNSQMVIDKLKANRAVTTVKEEPNNKLFDFIDQYIKENSVSREKGSLSVYKSLKTHLTDYQTSRKRKISFDMVDYAFFQDFQNFLITPRKKFIPSKKQGADGKYKIVSLNNTTIAKQLSTAKTFLGYAKKNGIIIKGNYDDFSIKKETLEVIALTQDEFELLLNLDLSDNKKMNHIRDVFCFSCTSGFRYSDLSQLKREHIKQDEIKLTVTKTKEHLYVPLNRISSYILNKYEGQHKPLPVISNQKTNEYLKELCKIAGIDEPVQIVRYQGAKRQEVTYPKYELVSIHTGRKTFATLSLEKGMSAEEVMKIGGWKTYASFKRYVNITEKRSKLVMHNAWGASIVK